MKKIAFFWYVFALALSSHAETRLSDCQKESSATNESLPMRVTKYLTIVSTVCLPTKPRPIFSYHMKLDFEKSRVDSNMLPSVRVAQVNALCTTPLQRNMLTIMDIQYEYVDSTEKYVGKNLISITDCAK